MLARAATSDSAEARPASKRAFPLIPSASSKLSAEAMMFFTSSCSACMQARRHLAWMMNREECANSSTCAKVSPIVPPHILSAPNAKEIARALHSGAPSQGMQPWQSQGRQHVALLHQWAQLQLSRHCSPVQVNCQCSAFWLALLQLHDIFKDPWRCAILSHQDCRWAPLFCAVYRRWCI